MPISGTESVLAALIQQKLVAAGFPAADPNTLAIWTAVGDAIIEHLVVNTEVIVNPGIPVTTAGGPTAQAGSTTGPGEGAVL